MKGIGLTEGTRNTLRKRSHSGEASPRLLSYDNRRQKAVFSNAFGFIDPYEGSGDAESESMMSSMSVTSAGGTSPIINLREDLLHDMEVVYFPQGSVLVEQGERHPGLYYVIDGFLDAGIPANERDDALIGAFSWVCLASTRGPIPEVETNNDSIVAQPWCSGRQRPSTEDPVPQIAIPDQTWWHSRVCRCSCIVPLVHRCCGQDGCLRRIPSPCFPRENRR
jgi:hypothetical protein